MQAGCDNGGRQTGGHAVLQTEHDHRKPERVGIGSGNERKENLFRQHGGAEEQRELEGEAQRGCPPRAPDRADIDRAADRLAHRRLLRPNSSCGSPFIVARPM